MLWDFDHAKSYRNSHIYEYCENFASVECVMCFCLAWLNNFQLNVECDKVTIGLGLYWLIKRPEFC